MRILVGVCLLGAVTTFGSAARAGDFAVPGVLRHMSLVVDVKDDHNGKGKHHHHHGDEAKQHHCKGNSCNDDGNADGGEASTNANKDATPSTIPNTDVLWGDYKYVKP